MPIQDNNDHDHQAVSGARSALADSNFNGSNDAPIASEDAQETLAQAQDLKGLLQQIAVQIADVDKRHSVSLRDMHERLAVIGARAQQVRSDVPGEFQPAFDRIEDAVTVLADKITAADHERSARAGPGFSLASDEASSGTAALFGKSGDTGGGFGEAPGVADIAVSQNAAHDHAAHANTADDNATHSRAFGSQLERELEALKSTLTMAGTAPGRTAETFEEMPAKTNLAAPGGPDVEQHSNSDIVAENSASVSAGTSIACDPCEPWDAQSAAALTDLYYSGEEGLPPRHLPDHDDHGSREPAATALKTDAGQGLEASHIDQAWLEARFADVAARVEMSLADAQEKFSLEDLGARFDQLEVHITGALEEAVKRPDADGLALIEDHLGDLTKHLQQTQDQLARLDSIDDQIGEVMRHMTSQMSAQEEMVRAIDAAPRESDIQAIAETVALQFATKLADEQPRDNSVQQIDGLHSLLEGYIDERREGEKNTSGALDTMQSALIHLLERVDAMELNLADAPLLQSSAANQAEQAVNVDKSIVGAVTAAAMSRHDETVPLDIPSPVPVSTSASDLTSSLTSAAVEHAAQLPISASAAPVAELDAVQPASTDLAGEAPHTKIESAEQVRRAFDAVIPTNLGHSADTAGSVTDSADANSKAAATAASSRGAIATPRGELAGEASKDSAAISSMVVEQRMGLRRADPRGPSSQNDQADLSAQPLASTAGNAKADYIAQARRAQKLAGGQHSDHAPETLSLEPDREGLAPVGATQPQVGALKERINKNNKTMPKSLLLACAGLAVVTMASLIYGKFSTDPQQANNLNSQIVAPSLVPTRMNEKVENDSRAAGITGEPKALAPASGWDIDQKGNRGDGRQRAPSKLSQDSSLQPQRGPGSPLPAGITVHNSSRKLSAAALQRIIDGQETAKLSSRIAERGGPRDLASNASLQPSNSYVVSGARATNEPNAKRSGRGLNMPPALIGPLSLRLAAAKGDPSAEFEVAARFAEGKGIKQDYSAAVKWYRRSAARGFAPAQYRLGTLYERGMGVGTDLARSRIWYLRAAKQGNVKAMHNLAVLSAGAVNGTPDYATAVQWFTEAGERGLADSQFNLGILYSSGLGVVANKVQSYKWFSLAAARGDKQAGKRADMLRTKLTPAQMTNAERLVRSWRKTPVERLVNDPHAAGRAWSNSGTLARRAG